MSEHYVVVRAYQGYHETVYTEDVTALEMEHLDEVLPVTVMRMTAAMARHHVPVDDLRWEGITR